MLKKPTGRRLRSTLGLLLPVIVAVVLLQMLFGRATAGAQDRNDLHRVQDRAACRADPDRHGWHRPDLRQTGRRQSR